MEALGGGALCDALYCDTLLAQLTGVVGFCDLGWLKIETLADTLPVSISKCLI